MIADVKSQQIHWFKVAIYEILLDDQYKLFRHRIDSNRAG